MRDATNNIIRLSDTCEHEGNLHALFRELDWLEQVIASVIGEYLQHEGYTDTWSELPLPQVDPGRSMYERIVHEWELNTIERLTLALAMAPHLRPQLLDIFFGLNQLHERPYTEFGGVVHNAFSGFLPTGQTLLFLAAANDPIRRLEVSQVFKPDNRLIVDQVITLESDDPNLPRLSGLLCISDQWIEYFLTGKLVRPEHSAKFPAQAVTTPLDWRDLVLDDVVMSQIQEIRAWINYGDELMDDWGLAKKIKPGYRALFYGPPGTGKTLTASLIAKSTGREVYRVDLSMIVSKYIGETEKNLSRVFDVASHKDWVLFFDEADALFGRRTIAASSNDRHANQQTGYLLQRIEDFPGVVILASNLRTNIDEAFTRRFQSMVHFTMPSVEERHQLWTQAFSGSCKLKDDVDLWQIADKFELSGGSIINVLRHCALIAISRDDHEVGKQDLTNGIRREFRKDNRTIANV